MTVRPFGPGHADWPRMPSDEMLGVAIMWLEHNEGEEGEADACRAVAQWLKHERMERMIRREARRAGIPPARLRRLLHEKNPEFYGEDNG